MIRTFFIIISLLLISSMLLVGQTLYKTDVENNVTRDIYNLTSTITPPNSSCEIHYVYDPKNLTQIKMSRLNNVMCSFTTFVITSSLEVIKFGVEYGYENPQYDYNFFLKIFKIWIIVTIIAALIPIIIPLIGLIYIIFVGIKILFRKFFPGENESIKNG